MELAPQTTLNFKVYTHFDWPFSSGDGAIATYLYLAASD